MASRRKTRPPLVEVTWLDAVTYTRCVNVSEVLDMAKLAVRTTSGYLLHEKTDDGRLILSHTYDTTVDGEGEDEAADITIIPAGWVKSIRFRTRRRKVKS